MTDIDGEFIFSDEEDEEPFCNCGATHGIEEVDWNRCGCCGKPIFEEEQAVSPAPTIEGETN